MAQNQGRKQGKLKFGPPNKIKTMSSKQLDKMKKVISSEKMKALAPEELTKAKAIPALIICKTSLSKRLDKRKKVVLLRKKMETSAQEDLDKAKAVPSHWMKTTLSKKAMPAKVLPSKNLDRTKVVSLKKKKMEAMPSEKLNATKVISPKKTKVIPSKKLDRTKAISSKKVKAMRLKKVKTKVISLKKMKVILLKKLVTGKAVSSNNKTKAVLSPPPFRMGMLAMLATFLLMFFIGGVGGQSAWQPQLNASAGQGVGVTEYPKECDAMFSLDGLLELESGGPTPILDNCSAAIYANVSSNLDFYTIQLGEKYSFCSEDPIADRDSAFDFSKNLTFMGRCFAATKGGLLDRTCSSGEIEVYFQALLDMAESGSSTPSIVSDNCNDTTWSQGCESGWCSSLNSSAPPAGSEEYKQKGYIPLRASAPEACCEGFFCPMGLTCMIPCPLGSYCPRATLNHKTGLCEPYNYRVALGRNNTCGGANFWADFSTSSNIFCPAGNYCPTTTYNITCDEGHYCSKGSISQSRCFQLVSCDAKATTQNIKRYGVMLIVALALILLIFYNCSDQVMHVQDRRKAKARERALRQVRGSLNAAERWKKAAAAVRRARGSSNLGMGTEETQTLAPPGTMRSDMSTRTSFEGIGEDSSYRSRGGPAADKRISPFNVDRPAEEELHRPPVIAPLPRMPMPADNRSGGGGGGFKQRLPSTRSQIMRYAYNQIEKEKALQNKPLSWNDVIVHAGQPSGRDRLKVEIEFNDLCLILKGSGKKILCDVTGKLSPGRVTAVMGPSGAGKTTFLNALAGKACNSKITGQILINGVENPIHSYKQIIGFVPQDDIVHGNLTVEENLWFSANYRLPLDMPKAEKVLVVERIIESLGLQHIRASKVGTVEKRGISGGQRKRVNVGLEMVMEPSLLILDEPTSGLDSTSSQLVLKALRREAVVGVNVGVVLHQPSYGLFRMFDDVMFLAKGGRTVYLGPVDEVEAYFRSLNILVPERINPPDHFMDVLEGIAKPTGEPNFDPKILPIEWINHMGYMIPADLQRLVTQTDGAKRIKLHRDVGSESVKSESLMLDLCREFVFYLGYRWDEFKSTFNMAEDNSRRSTPGFFTQFKLIIRRVAKQRFREANLQVQDYIILLLAGACLGALSPVSESNLGAGSYAFTIIALSLLCMIASLRTFSNEKLQYWRESASGINRIAYFLAKDTVDHFNTILKPVVYLSMFYFFNNPRSTFAENYVVTLALVYAVVGISYIFAITMDSGPAQLWSVFFPVISTLIVTRPKPDGILKLITNLTYASWAQEAYVIANARRYSGVWLVTRCLVLGGRGYRVDNWLLCVGILLGYGFIARVVAMLCLIFCNRNKQK